MFVKRNLESPSTAPNFPLHSPSTQGNGRLIEQFELISHPGCLRDAKVPLYDRIVAILEVGRVTGIGKTGTVDTTGGSIDVGIGMIDTVETTAG